MVRRDAARAGDAGMIRPRFLPAPIDDRDDAAIETSRAQRLAIDAIPAVATLHQLATERPDAEPDPDLR